MDAFLVIYLPIFFIAFIALVFVMPSVRVYRKTGINPFRFATRHNPTHDYVGNSMKLFLLILFITICIHSFSSEAYEFLAPLRYLEFQGLKVVGLILAHVALISIMIAQIQMRLSWRIGIDYENKTNLVTSGLFSISRNPIFLFLLMGLIGTFLIIPNAITLAILFSAYLILQITMRLEEEFLTRQHGQVYIEYRNTVRRLI